MKPDIAVAVSGGVDSMMAACLLKEQGHHVLGIHFMSGYESDAIFTPDRVDSESHFITEIGEQLGISIERLDCRTAFKQHVVDYFIQTYIEGRTPNPCMVCNPLIKFGTVLSFARELGADKLATGHYARIQKDTTGTYHLMKGIDPRKDQSYFLARLNQSQLAKATFPMGEWLKSDIKEEARRRGLRPVTKSESQDVCFIRNESYNEFIKKHGEHIPSSGPIVDLNGNVIGSHNGLHQFTIGQRRGINCPAPEPYYVVRIESAKNRLVVGSKSDLLATSCNVTDINWINAAPAEPIPVRTRVRYRHKEAAAKLYPLDEHTANIQFESPVESITPGQGAVFYQGDEVLGGGFISPDT